MTARTSIIRGTVLSMGLLLASGCGSGPDLAAVSGQVTLDGRPLPGASVSFEPTNGGGGSHGTTDDEGRFELRHIASERAGAVVGQHIVRISTATTVDPSRDDSPMTEERVPPAWRDGSQHFDVPPEGAQPTLELRTR